jgi:hypothetical protein
MRVITLKSFRQGLEITKAVQVMTSPSNKLFFNTKEIHRLFSSLR